MVRRLLLLGFVVCLLQAPAHTRGESACSNEKSDEETEDTELGHFDRVVEHCRLGVAVNLDWCPIVVTRCRVFVPSGSRCVVGGADFAGEDSGFLGLWTENPGGITSIVSASGQCEGEDYEGEDEMFHIVSGCLVLICS